MSTNANAARTFVSLDGDAYRSTMGTALPAYSAGPPAITSLSAPGATWDAYGGVQAGFTITPEQSSTDFSIWNAEGTYRSVRGPRVTRVAFTPVDASTAATKTRLSGGAIAEVEDEAGVFEWTESSDPEEFALILDSRDGDKQVRFWFPRVTLDSLPAEAHNRDQLTSFEFTLKVLAHSAAPLGYRKLSSWNPTT